MKFILERIDPAVANLVYVVVCVGCAGCVLYVVATLSAGQVV